VCTLVLRIEQALPQVLLFGALLAAAAWYFWL